MSTYVKYTFRTAPPGWYGRNVTVRAYDLDIAREQAREELDRRDRKANREGPVCYDLYLLSEVKP